MTVKELIEKLSGLDPSTRVLVAGYEGGYSDADTVGVDRYVLNHYCSSYYGPHELVAHAYATSEEETQEEADCVLIG
jgi:hypothetical protein